MPLSMKNAIAAAFLDLAEKKPVDKITVKDIVEKCSITRQTFYYHFQDIMEVIEWSMEQRMKKMLERDLQASSMQEGIRSLLATAVEDSGMLDKLFHSRLREQAERLLISTARTYFETLVERKNLFPQVPRANMDLALTFYSYAIMGVMMEVSHRPNPDVDGVAEQLCQLIDRTLLFGGGK